MTAEVVDLNCTTCLDVPSEKVLQMAIDADLEGVVIVGWGKDGQEYFASSYACASEAGWALQRGLWKLNTNTDRMEDGNR